MNTALLKLKLKDKLKLLKNLLLTVIGCFLTSGYAAEQQTLYSNWSTGINLGHYQANEVQALKLSLEYAPWQKNGLTGSLSFELLDTLEVPGVAEIEEHNYGFVHIGMGYQWHLSDWQIVPRIKLLAVTSALPELSAAEKDNYPDSGDILGQLSIATYYEINDRWRFTFSIDRIIDTSSVFDGEQLSLGINYRLGKVVRSLPARYLSDSRVTREADNASAQLKQDTPNVNGSIEGASNAATGETSTAVFQNRVQTAISAQQKQNQIKRERLKNELKPHAVLSAASPVMNSQQEFQESNGRDRKLTNANIRYSVQIGSFSNLESIDIFVKAQKLDIASLYTGTYGKYYRLLYGDYNNRKLAQIVAEQFLLEGVDNLVVKLDFSKVARYTK